jgi:hypothetical protein
MLFVGLGLGLPQVDSVGDDMRIVLIVSCCFSMLVDPLQFLLGPRRCLFYAHVILKHPMSRWRDTLLVVGVCAPDGADLFLAVMVG